MIRIQTPVGSSLQFTDAKFRIAEEFLSTRPEILRYFGSIGGFGGGEVNTGNIFVTLKNPDERKLTQHEVMDEVRKKLHSPPEMRVTVQDLSMRGFSASRGFPVEFSIQGPDWEKLAQYSKEIMAELEKTGLVADLDSDYRVGMPEIQIVPDRDKAAVRGVSVGVIGETINALIGGVLVGRYPKGGHRYDIRLKLEETGKSPVETIQGLFVRNNRGELIRLADVVQVQERLALQNISRKNRQRAITVNANVKTGASQQKALEAVEKISKRVLPDGYQAVLSGSAETFKESFNSLIFALLVGIVVAYMVLASQFNSFIHPVTVLIALPFSISGAFVSLLVGGQSLNLYSMIGLILLMGIVKKNSILLVDFTNQVRERGTGVREALLEACPTRLRPILMTSLATIAGAIPPALAIGPGAESRIPMAIAVIGGVLISTFLTLYVVPAVYSQFARLSTK
jgi:HAE1 family hydrophobic/amphiphilic exporter-1